jgi:hypothetical protein
MASKVSVRGAVAIILFLPSIINGQDSPSSITPAEAVVKSPSAHLLDAETLQLTDAVLDHIAQDNAIREYVDVFGFESNNTVFKRQSLACKTFPGDKLWPSKSVWGVFDLLLGRRLLTTEPIASPCYDSVWGSQSLAECNALVTRFTKATTQ